jgi:hypothetical protein
MYSFDEASAFRKAQQAHDATDDPLANKADKEFLVFTQPRAFPSNPGEVRTNIVELEKSRNISHRPATTSASAS